MRRVTLSTNMKKTAIIAESVLHALAAGKKLLPIPNSMGYEVNGLNLKLAIYGLQAVRFLNQKGVIKQEIVLELAKNPEIQQEFGTSDFEPTRLKVIETAKVL